MEFYMFVYQLGLKIAAWAQAKLQVITKQKADAEARRLAARQQEMIRRASQTNLPAVARGGSNPTHPSGSYTAPPSGYQRPRSPFPAPPHERTGTLPLDDINGTSGGAKPPVTFSLQRDPNDLVVVALGGPFNGTFMKKDTGRTDLHRMWVAQADKTVDLGRAEAEDFGYRIMTQDRWDAWKNPRPGTSRVDIKAMTDD